MFQALACDLSRDRIPLTIASYSVNVELVADPESRACGLSNRNSLPDNQGMLFVFPAERSLSFWMRDTIFPLSIAFVDRHKIVMGTLEMEPLKTHAFYRSREPGLYALEMPAGWFSARGIGRGDKLIFELPENLDVR